MANVDADEHGLLGNLVAEGHAPEVTTKLGVHLADDVQEYAVVVLGNGPVGHKLRDDRAVAVDLVLEEGVEVLVVGVVRHDDQEDKVGVLDGSARVLDRRQHLLVVVVLDARGKSFQKILLVDGGLVGDGADVGVLDSDVEAFLEGEVVELVVDVVGVLDILLEADDGESLESLGLVHHRVEAVGVVEGAGICRVWVSSRLLGLLLLVVLVSASSLLLEVGRLEDLRLLKDLGLDGIGVELNIEAPLLDFLALSNHFVQLLNGVNSVMWLLEETLSHLGHGLFIFTDILRNTDKHGEFWRQINVLALLLDLKEGLLHFQDLLIILLFEVGSHGNGRAGLALLEVTGLRAHIETHIADLVRLVVAIARHDDSALELINDSLLDLLAARRLI